MSVGLPYLFGWGKGFKLYSLDSAFLGWRLT